MTRTRMTRASRFAGEIATLLCLTRRLLIAASGAGLLAVHGTPVVAHSLDEATNMLTQQERYLQVVDQPAPDFSLQDADGTPVSLGAFRGKVVVLYFIYASCPDVCPLQSEKLAGVQKAVNATAMRDRVQFIAITTDPKHDTPDVLRTYGAAHGLDPSNFLFLTSGVEQPEATRELALRYGLKFTPDDAGGLMHGVVTHLIDKSGHMRARVHGLKFNDINVVLFINSLTNHYH